MLRLLLIVMVVISTLHVNNFLKEAVDRVVGQNVLEISKSIAY